MAGQDAFAPLLRLVLSGAQLTEAQAQAAFDAIMAGTVGEVEIAAFLTALKIRGESVAEIAGAARAMRAHVRAVAAPAGAIDTCGTGGDGANTRNISTAAAIIVAACGVPVAKHGNKAVSSRSGSADVLAALGVTLDISDALIARCFAAAGIAFLLAPRHHAAMRHVAPVRARLGVRTIFNLLGPLANPAGARRQLIGVFDAAWLEPMAQVAGRLGAERVWVVHGADGLDELTTTGRSDIAEWHQGRLRRFTLTPEEAGLARAAPADLAGGSAAENAAALTALLAGARDAYRDIVVLNAAAALVVADAAADIAAGARKAEAAIDSGSAAAVLARWIAASGGTA
ncbi:MAG: anthranilate phosphoribosyltransferase [Alphaproteobacteria bacterium]|nr:MAG: anthranilate phosphoribosyltransferase [Alphaproteobacteria bacterium]